MERDLVFRLKADVDQVQVGAQLKLIGQQIQDAGLTMSLSLSLPDVQKLQQQLSATPLQVPVMLVAQGFSMAPGLQMPGMVPGGGGMPGFPGMPGFIPGVPPIAPQPVTLQPKPDPVADLLSLPAGYQPESQAERDYRRSIGMQRANPSYADSLTDQAYDDEMARRNGTPRASGSEGDPAEAISSLENANRKIEMISDRVNGEMRRGLYDTFEAVTRLGRGFAYIGVVGEEDVRKVLDVLMKVEATINLIRGGVDTFRGLSQAVNAYKEGLQAVATIQGSVSAAQGVSGVSGAARAANVGGDLLDTGGDVAGIAALGKGARPAGSVAGSGAAGVAGMSMIPQLLGGLAALVGGGLGLNAVGESFVYRGGNGEWGGAVGEYGLGGGARPGTWTAMTGELYANAFGTLSEWSPKSWRDWGANSSAEFQYDREALGESDYGVYDRLAQSNIETKRRTRLAMSREEMDSRRMLGNSAANRAARARLDAGIRRGNDEDFIVDRTFRSSADAFQEAAEDRSMSIVDWSSYAATSNYRLAQTDDVNQRRSLRADAREMELFAAGDRLEQARAVPTISRGLERAAVANASETEDVRRQLALAREQMKPGLGGTSPDLTRGDQVGGSEQIAELEQRLVDLGKQRLQIEQDVRKERADGLRESASALQQQVQMHQQAAIAARESLSASQQRFGLMDEGEAQLTMDAGRRMREIIDLEGSEEDDPERDQKLARAKILRQEMTQEDLARLRGTGTSETSDFVRSEATRRAEQRGFSGVFGDQEREEIKAREGMAERAQTALNIRRAEAQEATEASRADRAGGTIAVNLKDDRTLEVKIDRDDNAIASATVQAIQAQLAERDKALLASIEQRLQAERSRVSQMSAGEAVAAGMARRSRAN